MYFEKVFDYENNIDMISLDKGRKFEERWIGILQQIWQGYCSKKGNAEFDKYPVLNIVYLLPFIIFALHSNGIFNTFFLHKHQYIFRYIRI